MSIATTGLTGPFLQFANAVNRALDGLRSPPCKSVATLADLPNPLTNDNRIFIVDDIGAGMTGIAVSRGGVWKTGALL